MSHVHAFPCIRTPFSIYFDIFELFWEFSEYFFLPPYSLVYVSASWYQNISLLCLGTLFIPGHLPSNPTPSFVRFRDEDARTDFLKNFS